MDGVSSQDRMKNSNPASTKNVATKSNRPAIHVAASGRVPGTANRAEGRDGASQEAHSRNASMNTRTTFATCKAKVVACHAIGFTPAHSEVSASETYPIGRKNPSPPAVVNDGRMANWDVL